MTTSEINSPDQSRSLRSAMLLALPMLLLTFVILSGGRVPHRPPELFAFLATFASLNILFFLMTYREKTDRYRSIIFVTYAVCFVLSFISQLVEARGSMSISEVNMLQGQTPFCHMVIPLALIPALLTRTIIFPGSIIGGFASISSMLVIWLGASLSLGRGFCGWACFFGGLEDGFSRIFRKPLIKKINLDLRYLPFALLLVLVIAAAASMAPVYCEWLCPFKTVTEYAQVVSLRTLIQVIIFVSLFVGLVIVLPLLTKKRTQCGLFCPFGAFQSLTNKISAFDIRIDRGKCIKCRKCIQACPVLSLDDKSLETGKTLLTCIKCGKCADVCPKQAVSYHIKGLPAGQSLKLSRSLFLYPSFLFLATMAGGNIQDAIVRIILFVTTGSFLR